MRNQIKVAAAAVLGVVICTIASAAPTARTVSATDCFTSAAHRHGLDPALLRAVASAESSMRVDAINRTHTGRTGTVDIGLMQVNSAWLPKLATFGINARDLREPCTNIDVGAWILAESFARHGNDWRAVGAYNAACTQLKGQACTAQRARYAWRVYRRLAPALRPSPPSASRSAGLYRVNLQEVNP